jgi:SAM-dependent methyltransferase
MSLENVCPVCASTDVSVFFEIVDMPLHIGIQWSSQDAARRCPKGDIKLAFCHTCGFIANLAFDPARLAYSQAYDNSLHFSPFFHEYARSLATRLVERYNLHDKEVIEIGCGKGDFLVLLCELGNNRGVGVDPSYEGERIDSEVAERITFVQDFYSEKYASYQANLICCRYVLEHIQNPTDFLRMLQRAIGDRLDTVLFFEVPNVSFILLDLSIWDIIYEHCSYFSAGSLGYLFTSCGFDICDLRETYQGQYLTVEALPGKDGPQASVDKWTEVKEIASYVAHFADDYRNELRTWKHNLERLERAGQRVVAWGAGAKGVSFLNMLKIRDQIEYIVDINPHKHGKYIAGTGQQIVSPGFLQEYRPDVVILMNPIYKREIQQTVKELGLTTEFMCIGQAQPAVQGHGG